MAIRVVCFDLGGVLAHVAYTWAEAMQSAGFEPSVDPAIRLDGIPEFDLFQAGQLSIEAYLDGLGDFLTLEASSALKVHNHILKSPTEGTLEIVESLNKNGYLTSCLSNTNTPHWSELTGPRFPNIERLKLKAASQLFGVNKPDAAIYRRFEELAAAKPEEILFFEDTPINLDGAIRCGWHGVLVDPRRAQAPQIRKGLDELLAS